MQMTKNMNSHVRDNNSTLSNINKNILEQSRY